MEESSRTSTSVSVPSAGRSSCVSVASPSAGVSVSDFRDSRSASISYRKTSSEDPSVMFFSLFVFFCFQLRLLPPGLGRLGLLPLAPLLLVWGAAEGAEGAAEA